MRKLTPILAAVFVTALVAPALAANGGPKATGGVGYTVTSPAVFNEGSAQFNAQVKKGEAKGKVHVRVLTPTGDLAQEYSGTVDCYEQSGNWARFSGWVDSLTLGTNSNTGMYFEFVVVDNGEGRKAAGPDALRNRRAGTEIDCTTSSLSPDWDATNGNIQVHEA